MMRMTVRTSIAALGVAAVLFSLSACTCSDVKVASNIKDPEPVNVLVVFKSPDIFVLPHRVHLKEGLQYPVWVLVGAPDGAQLFIDFKDTAAPPPLEDNPPTVSKRSASKEKEHGVVKKGVPKKNTGGNVYAYKVTVKFDGSIYILDPDIEVDR
jgi:hypothetical protein